MINTSILIEIAHKLEAIEQNQNRLIELLTEKVGDKVRVRVNAASGQAATIRARQGRQAARWGISPEEWRLLVGENETIIPPGFDMAEAVAQLRSEQREIVDTKPRLRRGAAKRATATKKKATKKKATKKKATKKKAIVTLLTEKTTDSRDDALLKLMADVESLRALIEDNRTPAQQAQDERLYANVLRAPGIRKAVSNTLAGRARVGRAAKNMGMTLDEWTAWCDAQGWEDRTKVPSKRERLIIESGDQALPIEDEPAAPKRPRGRPKGSKDKKPRKKRTTKKAAKR